MNASKTYKIEDIPFPSIYDVSSELGRGKFAVVKLCKHKQTGVEFAAKFIRKRRKGVDCRKDIIHEINMLQITTFHPHFVNLLEVYENHNEMILVTELMRGGELFQYITTEGQIEESNTIVILRQIISGLVFLHGQNVVHMDIKPQNILLTKSLPDCHIKLCDLGLARKVNQGEDVFEIIGTPDYVAPEVLDYHKLDTACDMWSIGVLAYVMLSGFSPFTGDSNQETFLNISQVNLSFPEELFHSTSLDGIDFIKKLLLKEPENRLTAIGCLDHPWLSSHISPSVTSKSELIQTFNHTEISYHLGQTEPELLVHDKIILDNLTKNSFDEQTIPMKPATTDHRNLNIFSMPSILPKVSPENFEQSKIPA